MRILSLSLLSLLILSACGKSKPPLTLPENAPLLLTGDSAKTWMLARRINGGMRVNMGPCYLGYRQTFTSSGTFTDNNGEQQADCGKTMSGRWHLRYDKHQNPYLTLQSRHIPEAFGIDEDLKDFQIVEISEQKLVLRFTHALFTSKPTLIEDTYVPEGVVVQNRDFHW